MSCRLNIFCEMIGSVVSSLMIVYWFSRLRLALAEKGWKYTSTLGALPWIIGLFNSIYNNRL